MKRLSVTVLLTLTYSFLLSLPLSTVYAKTLVVGPDYATIGDALKEADDGDLIEVMPGEYKEKLIINKSVHLRGIDSPVISTPNGDIIEISKHDVSLEGFVLKYDTSDLSSSDTAIRITKGVKRTTIRDNQLLEVMFGVWSVEGEDVRIEKNTIVGRKELGEPWRGNCINLTGSQRVQVTENNLMYCRDGIYMQLCHDSNITGNRIKDSRYAIHTMWVDRDVFSNNTVSGNLVGLAIMYTEDSRINGNLTFGNKTQGLLFIQTLKSEVRDNISIGNTKGIFLYNSVYNKLTSNLVMNNQLGIHNWGGSEDNEISSNSFINNEVQVKFVATRNQVWDDNYWSDYIGWDLTGDGIGDAQYESNSVLDHIIWRYPMAKILYTSPALQMLWMLERQFPVFNVPKVIDNRPVMSPLHSGWEELRDKYSSYAPHRYYGEIEKMDHIPGGGS